MVGLALYGTREGIGPQEKPTPHHSDAVMVSSMQQESQVGPGQDHG
jgi:hypothetical protein